MRLRTTGLLALALLGVGCPSPAPTEDAGPLDAPDERPDALGPDAPGLDANIAAVWSPATDEVVWMDLATDGTRIYAAGYDAEGLMGGALRRTIVLAAYELDGTLAWRHELGDGMNTGIANAVEVDPSDGTVWFAGELYREVTLGSVTLGEIGGDDVFVLAVSPTGDAIRGWVRGGMDQDHGDALTIGPVGPVVAGIVVGSVDLGDGPVMAGAEDQSIFVATYDRAGAHRWSHVYTITDGTGIDVEEIDASPTGRVVLVGDLAEVVEVSFGGPPLTRIDGSFVLELAADGSHVRSWPLDPTNEATGNLRGVLALEDQTLLLGSFEGRLTLGGTELVSFGTRLSERCASMPADPECALLAGGEWVGWRDTFLARMDGPGTLAWYLQHDGTTVDGGARDLDPRTDTEVVFATHPGRLGLGGMSRDATAAQATLDGTLVTAGSGVAGSEIVAYPGGAIVSDSTGERGLVPGMHGSSTLSFVPLTP